MGGSGTVCTEPRLRCNRRGRRGQGFRIRPVNYSRTFILAKKQHHARMAHLTLSRDEKYLLHRGDYSVSQREGIR